MRYVIAVIVGLTILAFGSPVFADDHTWQRPAECEDKDRESPGNRSTPCKYVLPPLEKVEYIVHMVYPSCWEALAEAREIAVPVKEPGENVEEDQNGNGNG